jgi:nucleoside-diphosphate-sugar epimerase
LSVDNLSFVINSILKSESFKSGIYNVADDGFLSTTEIIATMAEVLEKRRKIWYIPKIMVNHGFGLCKLMRLNTLNSSLKKLTENYRVSNEKIKNELGLTEMPISSRSGLKATVNSFLN